MISVIITTIGRASLKDAIKSVLLQDYQDFEIIVVNDNPNKKLNQPENKKIKIINNEQNLGGARSLNIGLDNAKGKYIAILDDDDEWISKDKLTKQVKFLEDNPNYIMVGTDTEGCVVSGKLSLEGTPFAHSSMMFRDVGLRYDERLKRGKDLDLMLRLSLFGKYETLRGIYIKYFPTNDLKKKINDCSWHRKAIFLNRRYDKKWWLVYWRVLKRQIRLIYYDKIKNIIIHRAI